MIRQAMEKDIPRIGELLSQVNMVHHKGRPDIFNIGRKYSEDQLRKLLTDKDRPILVYVEDNDEVLGYCFGIYQQHSSDTILTDIKTLYIDDLCVDERFRGKHIGQALYKAALQLARDNGCYNITLNVWSCNPSALRFYEAQGMLPQKIGMEMIL